MDLGTWTKHVRAALDAAYRKGRRRALIGYGDSGIGKCLHEDALVLDATTGAYVPIREFDISHEVVTYVNGELVKVRPTAKIDNGVKAVYRTRTRMGREIVSTGNHPFLTLTRGSRNRFAQFRWVQALALRPGDLVATAHHQPFFGNEDVPDEVAKVLGFLLSEGSLVGNHGPTIDFTSSDEELQSEFNDSMERLGYRCAVNGSRLNTETGYTTVTSRVVAPTMTGAVDYLRKFGLKFVRSGEKEIPDSILRSPKRTVSLFLNRLFSGDGWIGIKSNPNPVSGQQVTLGYSSKSHKMVRQVQELLAKFGIVGSISKKSISKRTYWSLTICGVRNIATFLREIGFHGRDRRQKADEALRICEDAERNLHEFQVGNYLERHGLIFDRVVSVEPEGEAHTYDLTVPVSHNYVAEGLVVHNTQATESAFAGYPCPACGKHDTQVVVEHLAEIMPEDARGFLAFNPKSGELEWKPNPIWKVGSPCPVVYVLDEYNQAERPVRKAAMRFTTKFEIGPNRLPAGSIIILLANEIEHNADVDEFFRPERLRFRHIKITVSADVWFDWAVKKGIHPYVISFLHAKEGWLHKPDLNARYGEPNPRSWEAVSNDLEDYPQDQWDEVIAGEIGDGAAVEFMAWVQTAGTLMPIVDRVLAGEDVHAPELSAQFFVNSVLVDRFVKDHKLAERICQYAIFTASQNPEAAAVMIRDCMRDQDTKKAVIKAPSWKAVVNRLSKYVT